VRPFQGRIHFSTIPEAALALASGYFISPFQGRRTF
jgi:hypothetical protein